MKKSTSKHVKSAARRRLMTLAAGSVLATKTLPGDWTRPVVQSVMLPAHAQTSPGTCTGSFTQTQGYDLPSTDSTIPDQSFTFDLGGAEPCGEGVVRITNLEGDLSEGPGEQWTIWLGQIGSGVNLGQTNNSPDDCEPAPDSSFPVTLQQLQNAISGGSIVIEAENGGGIDDFCPTNTMDVTLEFPIVA